MERWYLRVVMEAAGHYSAQVIAKAVKVANEATPKPVKFDARKGRNDTEKLLEVVYDLGECNNTSAYTAGAELVEYLSARLTSGGAKITHWQVQQAEE